MRLLSGVIVIVAAILAAAAVTARAASTAPATARNCGVVRVASKKWGVAAAAVTCATAKNLVKKFAPRVPRSGVLPLGTYAAMSCTAFAKTSQRVIQCLSPSGKLVQAASPPG